MAFKTSRIETRIMVPVLVTTVVILTALGLLQTKILTDALTDIVANDGAKFSRFIAKVTAVSVANSDLSTLNNLITEMESEPSIEYAGFYDSKGNPLAKTKNSPHEKDHFSYFETPIVTESGKEVGTFRFGRRIESLKHEQNKSLYLAGLALVGTLFLIALILFALIRRISNSLRETSKVMLDSVVGLAKSNSTLNNVSSILNNQATEVAASLEETVASLQLVSDTVQRNADSAQEAASLSNVGREAAAVGKKKIADLVDAVADVAKSSKKISEIINLIEDIAFQTNLLSLNAAVEAARAGEHGKGFAVVAEAVRTLALKSSTAAKDITHLIREGLEKTERGNKIAEESGSALKEILESVSKLAEINQNIAIASSEQSNQIAQINKAVIQIDNNTQGNAEAARETSVNVAKVSDHLMVLENAADRLSMIVEGRKVFGVNERRAS